MASKIDPVILELRSRMGGLTLAATRNPMEYTAAGRRAFLDRFLDVVDPDRVLPQEERERRTAAAMKAHFTRMALLRHKARKEMATATAEATAGAR